MLASRASVPSRTIVRAFPTAPREDIDRSARTPPRVTSSRRRRERTARGPERLAGRVCSGSRTVRPTARSRTRDSAPRRRGAPRRGRRAPAHPGPGEGERLLERRLEDVDVGAGDPHPLPPSTAGRVVPAPSRRVASSSARRPPPRRSLSPRPSSPRGGACRRRRACCPRARSGRAPSPCPARRDGRSRRESRDCRSPAAARPS